MAEAPKLAQMNDLKAVAAPAMAAQVPYNPQNLNLNQAQAVPQMVNQVQVNSQQPQPYSAQQMFLPQQMMAPN